MVVGLIVLVTEGVTKLRGVPWHRRGKESEKNKSVIWAVY